MADNKTNYLENAILNHVLRGNTGGTAFTQPAALYLALFTAAPGEAGGGTEVSTTGTGYARQVVTFTAPVNGASENSAAVVFPKSLASWGNVTHLAIFDSVVTGNMLYYGPLSPAVNIDAANKKVEFESGAIDIIEQ